MVSFREDGAGNEGHRAAVTAPFSASNAPRGPHGAALCATPRNGLVQRGNRLAAGGHHA